LFVVDTRVLINQYDSWMVKVRVMVRDKVIVAGIRFLNEIGSNVEKISIIIKIWIDQLEL
jgi:hypothetical protein